MTAVALLRTETKRSTVPWVLPLLAAVYFFDTYRTASGNPPIWDVRASAVPDHMLFEFSVFAAGLAAWTGSREGRRKTSDLIAATARPAWARHAAALAGTMLWLVLAFLAGVAVLYVQTARQAAWGGPPLWPVAVGVVGVVTVTVIGFTAGVLFPGRFTAPLTAIVVLVLDMAGFKWSLGSSVTAVGASPSPYTLLSPTTGVPPDDTGLFYRVAPDAAIAQVMLMGGIAIAFGGVLGLAPALRQLIGGGLPFRTARSAGDRWRVRAVAVALVAAGVAASCTAVALAGTARQGVSGWDIPALHDAASDRPLSYQPDCTAGTGLQVCVHPAFSSDLGAVAAALDPVAAEIAGLPGAPARAEQVASTSGGKISFRESHITGNPPVFEFNAEHVGDLIGAFRGGGGTATWRQGFQQGLLDSFVAGPSQVDPGMLGPAQQAVVAALLTAVGSPPPPQPGGDQVRGQGRQGGQSAGPSQAQIAAAAQRFAALSPAARHAWLAAHLPALRANKITLAQLP
jgi:hypothetical protein